jgi:hypothetical protein
VLTHEGTIDRAKGTSKYLNILHSALKATLGTPISSALKNIFAFLVRLAIKTRSSRSSQFLGRLDQSGLISLGRYVLGISAMSISSDKFTLYVT